MAGGHGFLKHRREFVTIRDRVDFEDRVMDVMMYANVVRHLRRGRTAYYDEDTNTLVLHNPDDRDEGTMFKPTGGYRYVMGLQ